MNARVFVLVALVFCVAVARAEDVEEESTSLAGVETVEPAFIEETESGFPFNLPKKLEKHTIEPRYYGDSKRKHKKYVSPEYRDPKPVDPRKLKNQPVLFTSHYFSPLPKKFDAKNLKVSKHKHGRHLVPFRANVETPVGHEMAKKGFREAELKIGRLPNKFDDPRQNMKKTRAPAPTLSLVEVEVDTTEAMEAEQTATETDTVPPPFQTTQIEGQEQARVGMEHAAVVVADPAQFFNQQYSAPTWADEEATTEETEAADMAAVEVAAETEEEAMAHYNELDSFLQEAEAATASFSEGDESDEESDESEDEESDDEESDEESDEEADEEEEEAPEAAALVEVSGDASDMESDEMEVNERAAQQIDMDATSDEAAMADSDEDSSDAEADEDEEEVHEDAAVAEAVEYAENNEAAALVEEDGMAESVDMLLAEVDAHVSSDSDADADAGTELVVEAEIGKGTPGSSILPGQTWEQMQNQRLDAMEAQLEAEKAATPKVAATVVSSKAELNADNANTQQPEYDSEAESVETVAPEILVQTAQQVLVDKIAKLKAIHRS